MWVFDGRLTVDICNFFSPEILRRDQKKKVNVTFYTCAAAMLTTDIPMAVEFPDNTELKQKAIVGMTVAGERAGERGTPHIQQEMERVAADAQATEPGICDPAPGSGATCESEKSALLQKVGDR